MYEIYDFTLGRVVKEGLDIASLKKSVNRRKHPVILREKYSHYLLYDNLKTVKKLKNQKEDK